MEKKQTAVEWLIEQIKEQHPFWTDIFQQALQMEKEQLDEMHKNAYHQGWTDNNFPPLQY